LYLKIIFMPLKRPCCWISSLRNLIKEVINLT
jgi:hypothetical protein